MHETLRRYHHGDLRRALTSAGIDLIAEQGVGALTLRAVARRAGVSHNAPYNHFVDKAALLAAIVESGFAQLEAALDSAYQRTEGALLDRVCATGAAYVRFAISQPALFRLMFRPELREQSKSDRKAQESSPLQNPKGAVGVLIAGLHCSQEAGEVVDGDEAVLALASWSLVHGLAELLLNGKLDELASTPDAAADLALRVVDVLSMGLRPRRSGGK